MTTAASVAAPMTTGLPGKINRDPARVGRLATIICVAAGGLAIAAYLVLAGSSLAGGAFIVTSGLALAAVIVGPFVHRPASVLPWRWLALGMASFLAGNLVRVAAQLGIAPEVSWLGDIAYLGYVFIGIGLLCFIRVRRPRYQPARLVDGLAVGAAVVTVTAVPLLESALRLAQPDAQLVAIVTLVLETLLVGGTAYLVLAGDGFHIRAQQLLFLGVIATAVADALFEASATLPGLGDVTMNTLWLTGYLLVGLSALTPSMRQLTEPQTEEPQRAAGRALTALIGTVAVLTVVNLSSHLSIQPSMLLTEIVACGLILLIFVRAREMARFEARRERDLALLLANAADALTVVDAQGAITLANPAAARMFGVPESTSIGRPILEFLDQVVPEERETLRQRFLRVLATPDSSDRSVIRLPDTDGTYRAIDVRAANRLDDPAVHGVVLNFRDVTDQVRVNAQLDRLGTAIEQASDAVVVADLEGRIEYVNPAFEQMSGYGRKEVVGHNPRLLKSGEQPPIFYETMWQTLTSGQPWRADFVNRRKDGTLFRTVGVITPLRDEGGRLTGYVGVQRDVTRQRELETTAHRIARERALVSDTVRSLDPREPPEKIAQSLCNQLVAISGVTLAALFVYEGNGQAAPYGFAVANGEPAPRRRLPPARTAQLRERTDEGPFIEAWHARPGHPYNEVITGLGTKAHAYASVRDGSEAIGFMVVGSAANDAEDALADSLPSIVECADIAGALIGIKVGERIERSTERQRVTEIIDRQQFFPVYQPLCETATQRVVGYEALTRFEDGVAPDVRFAEAYEAGVGEKLELAAIEAALKGAADIPQSMWLNINATPDVIMDGGGLQRLLSDFDRDVVVEVTEHSAITDYSAFRRALLELGPRVRLAVDDAGSGFASLRHILELRPAFVKLDREVIAGIDDDEARQAMVAGLRHFAQTTGCWLIAEGVETAAELSMLQLLEVRYVQGYLLGRPAPADRLDAPAHQAQPAGGGDSTPSTAPRRLRR